MKDNKYNEEFINEQILGQRVNETLLLHKETKMEKKNMIFVKEKSQIPQNPTQEVV